MDSGDDDIASFFLNMGLARKNAATRKRRRLPLLTPEYMQNIPTFARNFFRDFYDGLKHPSVVVLDNYETIPETYPSMMYYAMGWQKYLRESM